MSDAPSPEFEAWSRLCKMLEVAGMVLERPSSPSSPLDRAEGLRYLCRITRAALDAFVEDADPAAPVLRRTVHETIKMGADNPDNIYLNANISGAYRYRIRGHRGSVDYLAFATAQGRFGDRAGLPPTGHLDGSELKLDADGSFEIEVSTQRPPEASNWLPMAPDTGTLLVRQTFRDREREIRAQLSIERIDGPHQPALPEIDFMLDALTRAGRMVCGVPAMFANWAEEFARHPNTLPLFDPARANAAGGDPNIVYYHGYWKLEEDEALLIEVTPPACQTWNFQIGNHWMESLDYRYHRIHLNAHTAVPGPDGSVRMVVAHRDPGLPNWIDTVGHAAGTMCLRWVRAEHHPEPRVRVVPVCELVSQRP